MRRILLGSSHRHNNNDVHQHEHHHSVLPPTSAATIMRRQHAATTSTPGKHNNPHPRRHAVWSRETLLTAVVLSVGFLVILCLFLFLTRNHVSELRPSQKTVVDTSTIDDVSTVDTNNKGSNLTPAGKHRMGKYHPSAAAWSALMNATRDDVESAEDDDQEPLSTTRHLAKKYCKHTNPPPGLLPPSCALHKSSKGPMLLVVTASEGQFYPKKTRSDDAEPSLQSISWLAHVRCPVIVVVKSNKTLSFRRNGQQWDPLVNGQEKRSAERMHTSLRFSKPFQKREAVDEANDHAPFESTLRKVARRVDAFVSSTSHASLDAQLGQWDAASTSQKLFGARSASWLLLKAIRGDAPLFLYESENVGDEALTIAEVSAKLSSIFGPYRDRPCNALNDLLCQYYAHTRFVNPPYTVPVPQWVAFVHGHRESWHGVDILAQLECLCLSETQERYRTLTTPARAFYLQCMPMRMNVTQAVKEMGPFFNQDQEDYFTAITRRSAALSDQFREVFQYLVLDSEKVAATVSGNKKYGHGYHLNNHVMEKQEPLERNESWVVSEWRSWLDSSFPDESTNNNIHSKDRFQTPLSIVRDCCATFVVSLQAITDRPLAVYESIARKIHAQPSLIRFSGNTIHPITTANGTWLYRDGEASMYLERFWRYLFQPTVYDNQRDYAHEHCDGSGGFFSSITTDNNNQKRDTDERLLYDCPPAFQLRAFPSSKTKQKSESATELLKVWRDALLNESWRCPASYLKTNIFR